MTISELIQTRQAIIQAWKDANEATDRIGEAFARIRDNSFHFDLYDVNGRRTSEPSDKHDIKALTAALDYSLFAFALDKLNITKAMTGSAKDEFLKKVKAKKTVFCEKELIGLAQNAGKLFRDSSLNTVRQVYRQLIGCSYRGGDWGSGKKDNLKKVEKVFRIGFSDLRVSSWKSGGLELDFNRSGASSCFHFNDLLTACRLIEGQGLTDYSNNFDCMVRSMTCPSHSLDVGYFIVTAYLNGNVKVNWNEDKIHVLEKLNAIGSGRENNLPDTMRKRYKAEHFHNGGMPEAEVFFRTDPKMDPNSEKDFAFYPTPSPVAHQMVELAECDGEPELSILEPSAGDGGLLQAIPYGPGCVAVEFNHHRAEALRHANGLWKVYESDFLRWEPETNFDRVLMNPPFNDRIEAVHVVKAWTHLKPGGILVAIVPEGWFIRDDLKSTVFRNFLTKYQHRPPEKLAAGTFKRTRIETRIVTLKKLEGKD